MNDERWNGFRLELAALELDGAEDCRESLGPWASSVQGVVFEPCGVLYDDSAWQRWLWQLASRVGLVSQYTPFFRMWECEYQERVWSGQIDFWTALSRFLRSAGMSWPDIEEVVAASRGKFRRFERDTRLFPDVHWTLRRLHASGLQLATIAHQRRGETKIRQRLEQAGICNLVARIPLLSTGDTSINLADWQRKSLETLPGAYSSWAFVARRQAGLNVARELGMLAVAFNHDADVEAEVYIDQFSQLEQLAGRQEDAGPGHAPAKAA